jgi:hypothetical protein
VKQAKAQRKIKASAKQAQTKQAPHKQAQNRSKQAQRKRKTGASQALR